MKNVFLSIVKILSSCNFFFIGSFLIINSNLESQSFEKLIRRIEKNVFRYHQDDHDYILMILKKKYVFLKLT